MQRRVYHWHTVYSKKEDKIKAMLDEFHRDLKSWYAKKSTQHPPSHTKFIYFENVIYAKSFQEIEHWYGVDPDRNIGFTLESASNRDRIPALILGTLMGASTDYGYIIISPGPVRHLCVPIAGLQESPPTVANTPKRTRNGLLSTWCRFISRSSPRWLRLFASAIDQQVISQVIFKIAVSCQFSD